MRIKNELLVEFDRDIMGITIKTLAGISYVEEEKNAAFKNSLEQEADDSLFITFSTAGDCIINYEGSISEQTVDKFRDIILRAIEAASRIMRNQNEKETKEYAEKQLTKITGREF
jgi:hypothetical protein